MSVIIDNLRYSLSGTSAKIIGYYSPPSGDLVIPSAITNLGTTYTVTSIGNAAFYFSTLTSVTIPSSIISIGFQAFVNVTTLTSVNFNTPSSLTSIGNGAFSGCTSLISINIPSLVTNIGNGVFSGCTLLTSVTLPSSLTSIGNGAFSGCTSLISINIPSLVTSIGATAFRQSGLTSLTIPFSVTSIGFTAFCFTKNLTNINVDSNNPNYSSQDGVLFNKNKTILFQYPTWNSRLTYTVPSTVTTIESRSFGVLNFSENKLENIVLNNDLLTILDFAFVNCKFTQINLPDKLTNIGIASFQSCLNLTSITIPSSVTNISLQAFNNCTNLTSVTFLGLIPTIDSSNFGITGDNVTYDQSINANNPNLSAMLAMFTTNAPLPIIPICFPAGTPVETDQGSIAIEKINPSKNTVRGKKIVAITKTVTIEDKIVCIEKDALGTNIPSQKTLISRNHEILYNKKMIKAKQLIGQVDGVYNKKYNGEVLYNVLLETHEKMIVNNLIVETLNPTNIIAQLYNGSLTETERNNAIININKCANDYKKVYGKMR